jgi:hypothetical protein
MDGLGNSLTIGASVDLLCSLLRLLGSSQSHDRRWFFSSARCAQRWRWRTAFHAAALVAVVGNLERRELSETGLDCLCGEVQGDPACKAEAVIGQDSIQACDGAVFRGLQTLVV